MITLLRWLTRLVAVGIVLVVLVVSLAFWMGRRSVPDYEADWSVVGTDGEIEIVRNTAAVPHIFALTDHDTTAGLAPAAAAAKKAGITFVPGIELSIVADPFAEASPLADDGPTV